MAKASTRRFIQGRILVGGALIGALLVGLQAPPRRPRLKAHRPSVRVTRLGATGYPGPSVELRWAPPAVTEGAPQPIAYRVYKDGALLATTGTVDPGPAGLAPGQGHGLPIQCRGGDQCRRGRPRGDVGYRADAAIDPVEPARRPVQWIGPAHLGSPVDSGGTPITGYEVSASPSTQLTCAMLAATTCLLTGLRNDQSYEFTVTARNAAYPALTGVESDPAFATPGALPSGPNDFRLVATGSTSAMLAWSPPSEIGPLPITAYQISVFEDRGPNSPRGSYAITTVDPSTASKLIEGLTPGYEYYFGVRAVTATGMGAMTENVIANPIGLSAAPSRVDILGVGSGGGERRLGGAGSRRRRKPQRIPDHRHAGWRGSVHRARLPDGDPVRGVHHR
jgi:hypothetical protein